jgi:hypothetical protein
MLRRAGNITKGPEEAVISLIPGATNNMLIIAIAIKPCKCKNPVSIVVASE